MKYLVSTLFLTMFLVACSGPGASENEIPEDLGAMKELLKTKRQEVKELDNFIDQLETAISEKDTTSKEEKQVLVTTKPVERVDFKHYVNLQGTVQADDMVAATSEVAGRILDLKVQEGDAVRRGQLIAKLDLESVKKQMLELGTSLSLAKTVYERQKRLWDQNIGSEIQFLEAKNNVERLEKNLDLLRLQLSKEDVYAPHFRRGRNGIDTRRRDCFTGDADHPDFEYQQAEGRCRNSRNLSWRRSSWRNSESKLSGYQ